MTIHDVAKGFNYFDVWAIQIKLDIFYLRFGNKKKLF